VSGRLFEPKLFTRLPDSLHAKRSDRNRPGKSKGRVQSGSRLPVKRFSDSRKFFFFDPDRLFDRQSVDIFAALLEAENSQYICLCNLGAAGAARDYEHASLFVHKGTSGEDFMSLLGGAKVSTVECGWIYQKDDYACASDAGHWCIYLERVTEVGVVAIRGNDCDEMFKPALELLKALPIKQAFDNPPSYGLSSAFSSEWRKALLSEYTPSPTSTASANAPINPTS
jgi:hypothetical protein